MNSKKNSNTLLQTSQEGKAVSIEGSSSKDKAAIENRHQKSGLEGRDEKILELVNEKSDDSHNNSTISDLSITIKEAKCYNVFLLKVGFEFSLYYLILIGMILFILLDVRRTRIIYRAMYLNIWMWVFFSLSIVLKIAIAAIGEKIRIVLKFLFFLDVVMTAFFIVGLYYWLQERLDSVYYSYSPFVVIYVFNLFTASILFIATTFYHSKRYRYNYIIGFGLMTAGTCGLSIGLFYGWTSVVTITIYQYIIVMVIMAVHNLFFSLNAHLLVKHRSEMYYKHDSVLAFYRFWTDIFFLFWRDLFSKTSWKIPFAAPKKKSNIIKKQSTHRKTKKEDKLEINEATSSIASAIGGLDSKKDRKTNLIA